MTSSDLHQRVARLPADARERLAARLDASDSSRALRSPGAPTKGPTALVAYYVSKTASDLAADDLRQFLAASLPAHLVPSIFRRIESVPRTVHGKVDTRALPDPVMTTESRPVVSDAAQSEIEEQLLSIWKVVLGIKRLGLRDSFFELGGDSLLAIRLLGQIRERWNIDLPMADLFDHPTVAGAATQIESVLWARGSGRQRDSEAGGEQEEVEF